MCPFRYSLALTTVHEYDIIRTRKGQITLKQEIFQKISRLTDEQADYIVATFSSLEDYQATAQNLPAVPEKDCCISQELSAASEKG